MDTNTLINLGCTGQRTTTSVAIPDTVRLAYHNMMSIFLKQDHQIEAAYIQVKDNNLSFSLLGLSGNVLFVKLNELTNNIRLPVEGDFLLEGKYDLNSRKMLDARVLSDNNVSSLSSSDKVRIAVHPIRGNAYWLGSTALATEQQTHDLELGLTAFSIPLVWIPIKGAFGVFKPLVTSGTSGRGNHYITRHLNLYGTTTNIPLTPHLFTSGGRQQSLSLIHSIKNESIVKDALPNDYDIANLAFLCEMPRGTIRKAISKIKKSKPFGKLNVLYDTTNDKVVIRVLNGTSEVQTTSISNNITYTSPDNISGSSSIIYPTWFDVVETRRQTPSVNNFTLNNVSNLPIQELFGVTKSGIIVYGLKTETATIMTSLSNLETSPAFDKDALDKTAVAVTKKRKAKSVKAPIVLSEEELLVQVMAQAVLRDEPFYAKWKEVSDQYCTDRNEPKVADLQKVFLNYFLQTTGSGGTITDEDRDEFNRLK